MVDKTQARNHPGVKRGVDQDVTRALTHLRVIGAIPWADITDGTRTTTTHACVEAVEDEDEWTDEYVIRLDPWEGTPPLLLVESRQAAGVLEGVVYEYRCAISGLGGHVHGHIVTEVVPYLRDGQQILYLGDLDLAGNQIEANVWRVIEEHAPGRDLRVARLGLTEGQADELGLEPIPKRDGRYGDGRLHDAVELEAMGQRRLTQLVRDELQARLPGPMREAVVRDTTTREFVEVRESEDHP